MKQTIGLEDFRTAFHRMGRGDNFSYEGLEHLFNYLTQYEEDCDIELELDVIAFCCEYNEESIKEALENYNLDSIEELESNTSVIWHDDETVIYQAY